MRYWVAFLCSAAACGQPLELAHVVSRPLEQSVRLPGEFAPYDSVELRARVNGYVDQVLVDRGSFVKKGQLLVVVVAPEMKAQIAEAESRAQAAVSQRAEAEARLAAVQSTYDRLKTAAETPGAIAGNELIQAEKSVEAAKAAVTAAGDSVRAARALVDSVKQMEAYLNVTAPFSGVVTDRLISPGALVGPGAVAQGALLRIEDNARLRLVVAVPEADVGGIVHGARVAFTVPAYPGQAFHGTVARVAHSVDPKTRTMSVELDVSNPGLRLAPGMFPEVAWPVRRGQPSLLVPATSVVTTTERTFVIRDDDGRAQWVDVRKGSVSGDQVEVFGALKPGETVVKRASDEIRPGAKLR
jgi:membrane fusion protein (multidrug efflux system)